MSLQRELLEHQRDQALRDLLDLERQVNEGEIPDKVAESLRRRYEANAARAIDALEQLQVEQREAEPREVEQQAAAQPRRRPRARSLAYLATAAVAVLALAVILLRYVSDRPDNGFVTGNEVAQPGQAPTGSRPPPRDLSTVTEAEMEAVISANPNVLGMRLALAERYVAKGRYDKAAEHYGEALNQAPNNPDVQAQSGWLLFKMGKPSAALRFIDRALELNPGSPEALWFKANILLHGRTNPAAALELLRTLNERTDLPAELRDDVQQLMATAERAGGR